MKTSRRIGHVDTCFCGSQIQERLNSEKEKLELIVETRNVDVAYLNKCQLIFGILEPYLFLVGPLLPYAMNVSHMLKFQ